jgi:hypothetical protein
MAKHQQLKTDMSDRFFKDICELYPISEHRYKCTSISDVNFCQLGVLRCLGSSVTGQEFLQHHADEMVADIDPGHFFKALGSPRRLANLESLDELLAGPMRREVEDPCSAFPELDGWRLCAGDGHYHGAASFDPKSSDSEGGKKSRATGHFFRVDMRTHHMGHIDMASPKDGRKTEHDMRMLKRTSAGQLRNGAPNGMKAMYVRDKASIDYVFWEGMKNSHGIYVITMEKINSAAEACSPDLTDRSDARNGGVVSCRKIRTPAGVVLRRIVYVDPKDGVSYTYITNDMTLPPFVVVLLYKHRWDLEKMFYQFKSKFKERKSRGSSPATKKCHALFECIAHNLLLLFEKRIETGEGVSDEVEPKKREGRAKSAVGKTAGRMLKKTANTVNSSVQRATHRTQRFIRWVRVRIYRRAPWGESMDRLRSVWGLT